MIIITTLLFFFLANTMLFADDYAKKQQIKNKTLFLVETYDGKRYLTSDPIFHIWEHEELDEMQVPEKYKKQGVKMMFYTKMASDVKVMKITEFFKKKGIVISKKDSIFSGNLPLGTLYEPLISVGYVTGVKRIGHRIYLIENKNARTKSAYKLPEAIKQRHEKHRKVQQKKSTK